ncbi:hypothetical protein VF02_37985 [Nostoc linckia z1]|nr:hypothetical protein VF02_37985 [Nostoc linckia z1]
MGRKAGRGCGPQKNRSPHLGKGAGISVPDKPPKGIMVRSREVSESSFYAILTESAGMTSPLTEKKIFRSPPHPLLLASPKTIGSRTIHLPAAVEKFLGQVHRQPSSM